MGCFWCCMTQKRAKRKKRSRDFIETKEESFPGFSLGNDSFRRRYITDEIAKYGKENISSEFFTYEELCIATNNFNYNSLIGEGGFGRVYKGHIATKDTDVAVKKLDRNGYQGNREFLVEALLLSLLDHSNLAEPLFRDRRQFHLMADPLLEARYPRKGLYQALAVTAMCLQEDATKRPIISQVVKALEYLCSGENEEQPKEDQNDSSEKDEGLVI
ncbi:protein kinase superfamily protein [Artemisia annua]|uniref:Protein kinase superfamily protein n=1 Tax=Artemisia annua TaxID=35608 RepID=A0A2U1MZW8_ARTAN|nr:protein kinase superfamily protein [Artemisia annua]